MYNLEPPLPQAPVCQAWAGPDQGRVRWASPGGRSRSCGISALAGRCQGVGPRLAAGGRWGGSSWWPHGGLPAGWSLRVWLRGSKVDGPPLGQQRTDACGTTQRDPRSPGHRQTKGEGGSRARSPWPPTGAVCWHTRGESTWHGTPLPGSRCGSPTPAATGPAWCRGGAAAQSTFSTLPMIFSSKTGRTASSSRTSSNTTPQSNSSLTFLK